MPFNCGFTAVGGGAEESRGCVITGVGFTGSVAEVPVSLGFKFTKGGSGGWSVGCCGVLLGLGFVGGGGCLSGLSSLVPQSVLSSVAAPSITSEAIYLVPRNCTVV